MTAPAVPIRLIDLACVHGMLRDQRFTSRTDALEEALALVRAVYDGRVGDKVDAKKLEKVVLELVRLHRETSR